MWHWAAKLVGPFICSWYIGVQAFAGCRVSSLIFPNQYCYGRKNSVLSWDVGFPKSFCAGSEKPSSLKGGIGCSRICVCLAVDHLFYTSFCMLVRMLF